MAEELKKVANEIVDKVLDSIDTEIHTTDSTDISAQPASHKRSILCLMFSPSRLLICFIYLQIYSFMFSTYGKLLY